MDTFLKVILEESTVNLPEIKRPKVILFSHTKHPYQSIALAVSAWTSDEFVETPQEIKDVSIENVDKALRAYHRTALEYLDMVFIIKNVSRAFQQQLTRTRQAGYSIQSLRVVTKKKFATNGHYTMPPSLNKEQQEQYHKGMLEIEKMYEEALESGVPVEDARGLLPLNIHSDITMHINFSSLLHMTAQRLCVNTQWEYRQVVLQMKQQIDYHLGGILSSRIEAPCVHANKCVMRNEYCGVKFWDLPEEERIRIYHTYASCKREENGKVKEIIWLD